MQFDKYTSDVLTEEEVLKIQNKVRDWYFFSLEAEEKRKLEESKKTKEEKLLEKINRRAAFEAQVKKKIVIDETTKSTTTTETVITKIIKYDFNSAYYNARKAYRKELEELGLVQWMEK